jgi:DNA excision repair protein ERCC-8
MIARDSMLRGVGDFSVASQFFSRGVIGLIASIHCESVTHRYSLAVTDAGNYFSYDIWNDSLSFLYCLPDRIVLTDASWLTYDTGLFCTSSMDGYLRLYDTSRPDQPLPDALDCGYPVRNCEFNSKAPIIAAALEEGYCRLWDIREKVHLRELTISEEDDTTVVKWIPDSEYSLVVADVQGRLAFFDIRNDKTPYFFSWWRASLDQVDYRSGHDQSVIGLTMSANGRILYSLDTLGYIREWDIDRGLSNMKQVKVDFTGVPARLMGMCLFENELLVPVKNAVYNMQTDQAMIGHANHVVGVTAGADEFVSAGTDGFVIVWRRPSLLPEVDESDWSD